MASSMLQAGNSVNSEEIEELKRVELAKQLTFSGFSYGRSWIRMESYRFRLGMVMGKGKATEKGEVLKSR